MPVDFGIMATAPTDRFSRRALRIAGRALRRRCPDCGGGGLFTSWFRMRDACPQCGLPLERQEHGYIVGAYMLNIAAAELVFVVLLVGMLWITWPDPPWRWLTWSSAVLMVVLPVAFYPFSKTLFLGLDLLFRPAGPGGPAGRN